MRLGAFAALAALGAAMTIESPALSAPCHAVSFHVVVAAGRAFSKEIGERLALRLLPQLYADPAAQGRALDGWQIVVMPVQRSDGTSPQDRIYPVNPPLRFNPRQDLGTSYGIAAAEKLRRDILHRFVWQPGDYEKIAPLVDAALSPYAAADPDHAGTNYAGALLMLDLAQIRLHPLRYELGADGLSIRRLALRVTITTARDFTFAAGLPPEPAACPQKQE